MNKIFFLILLLLCDISFAKDSSIWNFQYSFNLKKDKIATVFINESDKNKEGKSLYVLKFRWTLYANKNLILLLNYMGYPHQYVLKKKRSMDRVRIKLLADGNDYNGKIYALIVFSDFNKKENSAILDVYIKDETKKIRVDFKQNKD